MHSLKAYVLWGGIQVIREDPTNPSTLSPVCHSNHHTTSWTWDSRRGHECHKLPWGSDGNERISFIEIGWSEVWPSPKLPHGWEWAVNDWNIHPSFLKLFTILQDTLCHHQLLYMSNDQPWTSYPQTSPAHCKNLYWIFMHSSSISSLVSSRCPLSVS